MHSLRFRALTVAFSGCALGLFGIVSMDRFHEISSADATQFAQMFPCDPFIGDDGEFHGCPGLGGQGGVHSAAPRCGNNVKEAGEQCDLGDYNGGPGVSDCSTSCTINRGGSTSTGSRSSKALPACGNGVKEKGEKCDLGNGNGAWPSLCSTACAVNKAPPAVCGNGTVEKDEKCDLGNGNGAWPSVCSATCSVNKPPKPVCGNGVKEGSEACDLGAANGEKGVSDCSLKCKINR